MAGLKQRSDAIRAGFESKAPPEALEIMHRATKDLAGVPASNPGLGVGVEGNAVSGRFNRLNPIPDDTVAALEGMIP